MTLFSSMNPEKSIVPIPMTAVACIGMATLLFEILLTRIFSVTMWYHFAFMAISLALFGLAASGVFVSIIEQRLQHAHPLPLLGWSAMGFAIAIPLSFLIDHHLPFYAFESSLESQGVPFWLPYASFSLKFLVLAVPFFFSGLVLAIIFSISPQKVHKVYFADLAGGGLGCLLVVPLLLRFSAPAAIFLASCIPFLAAYLFFRREQRKLPSYLAAAGFLATACLALSNDALGLMKIVKVKSYNPQSTQIVEAPKLYERWHPVSRVAVHPLQFSGSPYRWFYSKPQPLDFPRMLEVTNDGGARTFLYPRLSEEQYAQLFQGDLSDLCFAALKHPRVLVVGVGGGKDILSSLAFGASSVVGVEINPLMVNIVQKDFATFTGSPYRDPRVHIAIDEGRNYIASHAERYDLIKISVTDTWAASAMGAYALTENYLYTVEALRDYLDHLEPGGILSITRWYPQETIRLLSLAVSVLRSTDGGDPLDRLYMARNGYAATLLIKKSAFTPEEISALSQTTLQAQHILILAPGQIGGVGNSPDDKAHRNLLQASKSEIASSSDLIVLDPPTDDRPFFFNLISLRNAVSGRYAASGGFTLQHGRGIFLLIALLKITVVLALLLVIAPLLFRPRRNHVRISFSLTLISGLYFLCLGFGFMLVEIPLMQHFILFLGHPVYALTVILFSVLIFSSIGSLLSTHILRRNKLPVSACIVGTALLIALYGAMLPAVLHQGIGLPIGVRIFIATILIAPLGLGLGIPFPAGVERLHKVAPPLIAWAWAINGAASVAAPVLAMVVAINSGFSAALFLGGGMYLIAAVLYLPFGRRSAEMSV